MRPDPLASAPAPVPDDVTLDGTPVELFDEDTVVTILSGRADLRLVRPGFAGLDAALFPVEAGQGVFPLPFGGALRLVLHPEPGTRIRQVARHAAAREAARSPDAAAAWAQAVNGWLAFLGRIIPDLAAEPTSPEAWRASAGDGRLDRLFEATQNSAAQILAATVDDREAAHAARILRRHEADGAAVDGALREAARLAPQGSSAAGTVHGALEQAVAAVATALGAARLDRSAPALAEDPAEALADLARLWGQRVRAVRLEAQWWRSGGEPMVAFRTADGLPVALLPAGDGFVALLPEGERRKVSGDLAAGFHPQAFQLVRGFRPGRVGLAAMLDLLGRRPGGMALALMGYAALAAVVGLVPPYAISLLTSDIIPGGMRGDLALMALGLVAAAFGAAAFEWARARMVVRLGTLVNARTEAALWDRLLRLPAGFFRRYTAGDLALRADAVNQMRDVVGGSTIGALLGGLFAAFNLVVMLTASGVLTLIVLGLFAVEVAVVLGVSLVQLRLQRRLQAVAGTQNGLSVQLIDGIEKLRVANAESRAFARWADGFGTLRWIERRSRQWQGFSTSFTAAWAVLGTTAIYAAIGFQVATPGVGAFIAFSAAAGQFGAAAMAVVGVVPSLLALVPLADRAKPILEAEPEPGSGGGDPGRLSGAIDIQSVTFRYAANGPPILDRLSLHVAPGEFVAVVGPSGSGKSTLLRLLLGFEVPEVGGVFYDGRDLAALDQVRVRRQIGTVLQNGRLFGGSILENVAAGAPLGFPEAEAALELAGLAADVKAMPMGLHTLVGEGGGGLSGGQRQRLLIARAIARRPRIVLFDEATSALDNRTQAIVSASLERMRVTRIAIAHRLSTVQHADRILVMEAGAIVEEGRFEELMQRKGAFYRLAARQLG